MSVNTSLVNNVWLAFNFAGQWCLLGLILTYIFVPSIPQRKNPYLFNLLLATYFATIPGSLLVYAGNPPSGKRVSWDLLCFVQAALIDGCPPMFGIAQLALLYDTWSGIRASVTGKRQTSRRETFMYCLLIIPYFVTWIFVFASFIAGAQSKANHSLITPYCENYSPTSGRLRTAVGDFMLGIVLLEIGSCIAIGWTMLHNRKVLKMDPVRWRSEKHFVNRLFTLNALQLVALLLSAVGTAGVHSSWIKAAYEIMSSMNALALFIIIASQKQIVHTWITLITRGKRPEFAETQAIAMPASPYFDELDPNHNEGKAVTLLSQEHDARDEERIIDNMNALLHV